MESINYKPIGYIRSPFVDTKGTPIQPSAAKDIEGRVELLPEYADGLEDLEGFSHLILIYHFHAAGKCSLKVKPFLDDAVHGVFATRAPSRPNDIGLSIVRLEKIEGNILYLKDVDIIDGTPLLDIKPYVPDFDMRSETRTGWLEDRAGLQHQARDDGRFSGKR